MKSKMPEITTGQTVLIAKQKKRKKVHGKIPFLSHFLLLLVCINIFSRIRAESLNLMLINIYQSQNVTFIVVCLLPFTFNHSLWLLRQLLKYNA